MRHRGRQRFKGFTSGLMEFDPWTIWYSWDAVKGRRAAHTTHRANSKRTVCGLRVKPSDWRDARDNQPFCRACKTELRKVWREEMRAELRRIAKKMGVA